jgi:hypothetical protein
MPASPYMKALGLCKGVSAGPHRPTPVRARSGEIARQIAASRSSVAAPLPGAAQPTTQRPHAVGAHGAEGHWFDRIVDRRAIRRLKALGLTWQEGLPYRDVGLIRAACDFGNGRSSMSAPRFPNMSSDYEHFIYSPDQGEVSLYERNLDHHWLGKKVR